MTSILSLKAQTVTDFCIFQFSVFSLMFSIIVGIQNAHSGQIRMEENRLITKLITTAQESKHI